MPRWKITKEADIQRRIKQGRGKGEGPEYQPWIRVHEVPSRGRSHKVPGFKIRRTHHLLSDGELALFVLSEFRQGVVDLREQFPLFGSPGTPEIATAAGIRHPQYPQTRVNVVMTTDLLLTVEDRNGAARLVARTFKYAADLSSERTLEKLEIERRYWNARGVNWAIVTERQIPKTVTQNLDWIRSGIFLDQKLLKAELLAALLAHLKGADTGMQKLAFVLADAARCIGISKSEAVCIFKYCVWRHWIEVDLTLPIRMTEPVNIKKILNPGENS